MADDERVTPTILTRAPIVEALLDLHFAPATTLRSYGPIPGQMYERLREQYPEAQDLDAADIPISFDLPVPRHRFTSADGDRLFQVGNGLVSINTLKYAGFDAFRAEVEPVLVNAFELLGPPVLATLRYINKIPTDGRALSEVLAAHIEMPNEIGPVQDQRVIVTSRDDRSESEISVTWANPIDNRPDLILLDLSAKRVLDESTTLGSVMSWMDAAHDLIETRFLAILQPEFLEDLK